MTDKAPPNDEAAEKQLLAICLRDNAQIPEAVRLVTSGEFWTFAHQKLFAAIVEISDKGKPVNAVSVSAWIKLNKLTEDVPASYIAELAVQPRTGTVESCCEVIRNCAILRDLARIGAEIRLLGEEPNGPAAEMLQDAERKIQEVAERSVVGETVEVSQALREAYDQLDARTRNDGSAGITTGFADLDFMLIGMQDSALYLLAARPSVGKTAASVAIAVHVAADLGLPVLYVTLEQPRVEIAERLLCMRGFLDSYKLRRGNLTIEERTRILDAGAILSESPLYLDDTPGQRMLQIAANARRFKAKKGIKLLVVDYIQLIEPDNDRVSRQEQVSFISRRMKLLARELKIPVLACAQLNRQVEERQASPPRLSDLRESGSLEQDADTVLVLHRPPENAIGRIDGVIEMHVLKNRNGPTGDLKLMYEKQFMRFTNYIEPPPTFGPRTPFQLPPRGRRDDG